MFSVDIRFQFMFKTVGKCNCRLCWQETRDTDKRVGFSKRALNLLRDLDFGLNFKKIGRVLDCGWRPGRHRVVPTFHKTMPYNFCGSRSLQAPSPPSPIAWGWGGGSGCLETFGPWESGPWGAVAWESGSQGLGVWGTLAWWLGGFGDWKGSLSASWSKSRWALEPGGLRAWGP